MDMLVEQRAGHALATGLRWSGAKRARATSVFPDLTFRRWVSVCAVRGCAPVPEALGGEAHQRRERA